MELTRVVAEQGEDRLYRFSYGVVDVLVGDTRLAAEAVTSRHLCGTQKRDLFRSATAGLWTLGANFVMGSRWSSPILETVILRGADHVRPSSPGDLIGRPMVRTAIRLHRREVSPGNWAAEVVPEEGEGHERLFRSDEVVVWDGCSASGSTLKAFLWLLRQRNHTLSRVVVVCPFMGALALRRVAEQAEELRVQLSVLCLGVYRVAPVGYQGKTETDIYIPRRGVILPSHSMAVPVRQVDAYERFYQPRPVNDNGVSRDDDGFCLVGDVGESMAAAVDGRPPSQAELEEQLRYVRETQEAWPMFCQAPIPRELFEAESRLSNS